MQVNQIYRGKNVFLSQFLGQGNSLWNIFVTNIMTEGMAEAEEVALNSSYGTPSDVVFKPYPPGNLSVI